MDQFLRTSVVDSEREVDGRETDLTKRQEEDEVSQLPSDLPGAMLSSSDEEVMEEVVEEVVEVVEQEERKESALTDVAGSSHPALSGDLWVAQKQQQQQQPPARRSSLLMSKMRTSFDDLHHDLWAETLAEENSGVSSTPDRTISTAWGSGSTGTPPLPTSPLSATTRSEMSSLSDSERVPLDRIARIMRGGANGLQSSFTSSITSSAWSTDDEDDPLEEINML
jgi:hypothetical protein